MVLDDIIKKMIFNKKRVLILSVAILLLFALLNPLQIITAFSPAMRMLENQVLLFRIRDYEAIESENFIIKYQGIAPQIVTLVAETAEDKYNALKAVYQYEPEGKILLVIHNDAEKMMRTTMLRKGTPPMGVYYADSIHVLDPSQLFEENLEALISSEGPILHELAHLFTDHRARGNYPMWFTEGVSLYLEYAVDGYEWGQGEEIDEALYNIETLTKSFSQLNQYLAYTQSFRLVKGLVDRYGEAELMALIEALGKGKDLRDYYHMFN